MASVVLLRGVNVGGHRTFHPKALAATLKHLGAINIGAAGTFVVRTPMPRAKLRDEFARRLPFGTAIVIVDGRDILRMTAANPFADLALPAGAVRFVSVLCERPRVRPRLPVQFPAAGPWLVKVIAKDRRFVAGVYRRDMKTIGYLGKLDRVFGAPLTTRNWNTINAIAEVLRG